MKKIKAGQKLVIHSKVIAILTAILTAGSMASAAPARGGLRAAAPAAVNNSPPEFTGVSDAKNVLANAFSHLDVVGVKAITEYNNKKENSLSPLPYWQGLFEFKPTEKPKDLDLELSPWLKTDFDFRGTRVEKLDITNRDHALIFAQMMQEYVYEGWFNKENESNPDQQFKENSERTWCSTPWMVDGPKGREAVHGLTKEFPIFPGLVYKASQDGKTFVEVKGSTEGERFKAIAKQPVSWGTAFFNRPVCDLYEEIFGSTSQRKVNPDFNIHLSKLNPNGFVSFKLLFNTMRNWETGYEPWQGAYTWNAHLSTEKSDNERKLRKVPHIQMDISFKDSRLQGTSAQVDNWVMLTYVYDPDYNDASLNVAYLDPRLRHMKPVGVQFGFGQAESIIFENAIPHHKVGETFVENPHDQAALLNGPADNPRSSCLGCHGAAGLDSYIKTTLGANSPADEKRLFPGRLEEVWKFTFFENDHFQKVRKAALEKNEAGFDFNHQVGIAQKRWKLWRDAQKKLADPGKPAAQ